jgi:AP-1 complex subunit mu
MLCQTLLARNYRGDIPMSAVEKFPILLSDAEEESSAVPPCFSDEGINVCLARLLRRQVDVCS